MRYLSGIQPTGRLHLGNYFGMIRPAVELQAKGEAYYFLADYHALTGAASPGRRPRGRRGGAATRRSSGRDT